MTRDSPAAHRDIDIVPPTQASRGSGRRVVAAIGIDAYDKWPRLRNAVNDARAALDTFQRLGFEPRFKLFNEAATADAIRVLITDQLAGLGDDDSLVLFFAGHGHTVTRVLPHVTDHESMTTGYVIPVDGDVPTASQHRWLRIDHWLDEIARIPARHILVFLDACHSGVALGSVVRGINGLDESYDRLAMRRSRRVITSAQDNELAQDGGPAGTHSLFTGLFIEALDGGIAPHGARVTGTELGLHLRERVRQHPGAAQTPDFGAFALDRRGELLIPIVTTTARAEQHEEVTSPTPDGMEVARHIPDAREPARLTAWQLATAEAEARATAETDELDQAIADAELRERAEAKT